MVRPRPPGEDCRMYNFQLARWIEAIANTDCAEHADKLLAMLGRQVVELGCAAIARGALCDFVVIYAEN
jgi:hypothetical protein